jgi:hypothetical protein
MQINNARKSKSKIKVKKGKLYIFFRTFLAIPQTIWGLPAKNLLNIHAIQGLTMMTSEPKVAKI